MSYEMPPFVVVPPRRPPVTELDDREAELIERIRRLEKINAALMDRVERSTDVHGNAYSLFQTAINLELQVRARTEELTSVLRRLEQSNHDLRLAKEAADEANAYKTRFLAAAGHDLLQPLNAARLSISALTDLQSSDESLRITGQVDRALQTIEELLKTLLDISRLDAGVMQVDVRTVPLRDILASLASDFAPLVAQRGLELRVRPTPAHVRTDPLLLRRVLQNLLSNAVRYTPAGGIVMGVRPAGPGMLRIVIADTGPGIGAHEAQSVFEEFRRGRARAMDGQTGLGLGLAIVRRISQTLGHEVRFRATEGRGTTFEVLVPVAEAPAVSEGAVDGRAALRTFGVADARILVVENDLAVLAATERLLVRWSCQVETATDLSAAVTAYPAGEVPDLILADYHLDDGETGLDVIAALRETTGRNVPAVIVTANPSEDVARRVRASGVEIMTKPVKPAELRALIAHLLG